MAKGNNIHDEIKEQRKKLKDLSFSDKIKYIWSYYWIPIVGVVLAVIFAVSLISSIVKNNYDTVCFVAVLDGKMTGYENDTDILTTGLTDYLGIDGKKEQVDFSYTFSLKEVAMDQEAYVSANKLYTYASTGSLDGYLSEREYIDYFCTDKDIFFCDLRDIFSDEELEQLDDYIVYFTNTAGETYPIAVDITEAPVIKDSDLNMKDPCYGVVSSSKYQTNAADFIRYIFNMKTAWYNHSFFLYIFIPSVSPAYNVKPSFNASCMDGIFVFTVHIYNSSKPNLSLAISTIWFITSHATCFPCQLFFTRYPSS